jgi:hypothetical protein
MHSEELGEELVLVQTGRLVITGKQEGRRAFQRQIRTLSRELMRDAEIL